MRFCFIREVFDSSFHKLIIWLDIITQGVIKMRGVKKLTVFSRRVISKAASPSNMAMMDMEESKVFRDKKVGLMACRV